jgi:predicted phosphoribosyltransferase
MFHNRADAAYRLAGRLKGREFTDPLVLAIPRGGVITGAVLARELGADLDVILARKLRIPGRPESALGAVAENGAYYLNPFIEPFRDELAEHLARERDLQLGEITRRARLFREARPRARLAGRSVIVTDDGIATGATMIAALKAARSERPLELIVAVPVASPDRLDEVRRHCDKVVCLVAPSDMVAVGKFYTDFAQVEDEDVVIALREFAPTRHRVPA